MKIYKKTYENFIDNGYKKDKNSFSIPDGEMVKYATQTAKELNNTEYLNVLRYYWLVFQMKESFLTKGENRGFERDFLRFYTPLDPDKISFSPMGVWVKAVVFELCPLFFEKNPFTEPQYYKWPFKNIDAGYLSVCYRIPDKISFLAYADKEKMPHAVFLNWAVNQALCYNEEAEEELYTLMETNRRYFTIKYKGKDEQKILNSFSSFFEKEKLIKANPSAFSPFNTNLTIEEALERYE